MKEYHSDVLVVGGGIAGALAAIKAHEQGARVTLVDKVLFGRGGCAALASGAFPYWREGEDFGPWIQKMGGPLVNEPLLLKAVALTAQIIPTLESWGVKFVRDRGEMLRMPGSTGFTPAAMLDGGGPMMMLAIRNEALRRGVEVVDHVMVTDLLTSDGRLPTTGRVTGAVGIETRTAEPYTFVAPATVVATGPFMLPYAPRGHGYGGMPRNNSGDGQAMMLRAGAAMGKLELGGTSLRHLDLFSAPGLEMMLGHRGKFRNKDGVTYMERPAASLGGRRFGLGVETFREYQAGRGPVHLDISHLDRFERALFKRVIPIIMLSLESVGYESSKDAHPYTICWPATHGVAGAGAALDETCRTSLPGLWSAGGCSDGAYLTMGQNLGSSAALGWWAGDVAGREFRQIEPPSHSTEQRDALLARATAALSRPSGRYVPLHADLMEVPKQIGIVMDEASLTGGLETILRLRPQLQECGARDPHELVKLLGTINALDMLEMSFGSILRREESRGWVLRGDHPYMDNDRWLARTRCRMSDSGDLEWWDDPVPTYDGVPPVPRDRTIHPYFAARESQQEVPA